MKQVLLVWSKLLPVRSRWLGLGAATLLLLGSCVAANREFRPVAGGIPVYVVATGIHTDLLLPLREPRTGTDWLAFLRAPSWPARQFQDYRFVAFGWGNEAVYLAGYGGHRAGPWRGLRALGPSRPALQVHFVRQAPVSGRRVAALLVSEAQYRQLVDYVRASFVADGAAGPSHAVLCNAAGHTPDDFFYRAQGRYSLLHTCNEWTSAALRQANIRTVRHTLFWGPLLRQVRKVSTAPRPDLARPSLQ